MRNSCTFTYVSWFIMESVSFTVVVAWSPDTLVDPCAVGMSMSARRPGCNSGFQRADSGSGLTGDQSGYLWRSLHHVECRCWTRIAWFSAVVATSFRGGRGETARSIALTLADPRSPERAEIVDDCSDRAGPWPPKTSTCQRAWLRSVVWSSISIRPRVSRIEPVSCALRRTRLAVGRVVPASSATSS